MDLSPLITAPAAIQWHVATVLPAAALGAVQLARRKGTRSHRRLGYVFVAFVLATCLSAWFIRTPTGVASLGIAGALTLLPGRIMHQIFIEG